MLAALSLMIVAWPANLTPSLSGINLEKMSLDRICRFDPSSKYFLYTSAECDGGHRSVTLTRDRRMVDATGFDTTRFGRKPQFEGSASIANGAVRLQTGNGVAIGMSKSAVLKKLGKPARVAVRGAKKQYWCALYKKLNGTRDDGVILRNTYIFKDGKLIEIALNLDAVPGCGEDSVSDQGWPWSKF